MKYAVWLNIRGYVEVDARAAGRDDDPGDLAEAAFDQLSMDEVKERLVWMEDEVDEIEEIDGGFDLDKMTYDGDPIPTKGKVLVDEFDGPPHPYSYIVKDGLMFVITENPQLGHVKIDARDVDLLELL